MRVCNKKCINCKKDFIEKSTCKNFISRVTKAGYVYDGTERYKHKHWLVKIKDDEVTLMTDQREVGSPSLIPFPVEGMPFIGINDNPEKVIIDFLSRIISQDTEKEEP
ncbi:hypothetical protein KY315_00775 [Candidatus Woesearchaeota archaeon]|nr:hypothetical protein [Candidatus Woesearchaeota archaeon]